MNIIMLSDMEDFGGAAVSTGRLAVGLCALGHDVTRILGTRSPDGPRPWRSRSLHRSERQSALQKIGRQFLPRHRRLPFDRNRVESWLDATLHELRPDVISIHSLHMQATAGWSVGLARIAAAHAPIAWRLHDQWSFTGRCAYSYDCTRFISGCDHRCPTPNEHPELSPHLIAPAWEERRTLLSACPAAVAVAQSRWMASMARQGLWRGHRIEVVPNGLPLDIWRPADRAAARAELGLDDTSILLIASAGEWSARYKGGPILIDALRRLADHSLTLAILGDSTAIPDLPGLRIIRPGFIDDPPRCASLLSAADFFIHPALVDNFPNAALEAIACGVPVIALPVGGLLDMVRPGISGYLAARADAPALADAIRLAITTPAPHLRASCRDLALREYSTDTFARSYERVLMSLRSNDAATKPSAAAPAPEPEVALIHPS